MKLHLYKIKRHKLLTISFGLSLFLFFYHVLFYRNWVSSLLSIIPWLVPILFFIPLMILSIRKYFKADRAILRLILIFQVITLFLVFSYSGINTFAVVNILKPNQEKGIKVFTHNSQFWEDSGDSLEYIEYLKSHNADIYLIQEFINSYEGFKEVNFNFNSREEIEKIEENMPGYTVSQIDEFLTISKFPIIQSYSGGIELSSFLRTDLEIEGETVSFYNIHIPVHLNPDVISSKGFFNFIDNTRLRANWRKAEIENLIKNVSSNGNPKILSGDFNTNRNMSSLNKIELQNAEKYSRDLFISTWHSRAPLWTVDYTFFNEDIRFNKLSYVDASEFSDHIAQKFWFELKAK